ncbi:MAG: glycosyltransferase family 39 protein, partial [Acidimicrobiia bacterium]
ATALAVYFAYRYWRDPRWWRLALVGLASGAGALSRSELILIVPFMVVPLAVLARDVTRRDRWRAVGAAICAALVVMAPWLVFNLTRFEKPELLSTQFGPLLSSADCDAVWRGATKSYFNVGCSIAIRDREIHGDLDQSETDAIYRKAAFRYISHHKHLIPGVVAARLGAIVGLYQPSVQVNLDSAIEGREIWLARLGLASFWAFGLASVVGAVLIRRRRAVPLFPLLVPPVMVVITVALTYASTRFRASAEVVLCVLAAVAIDALVERVRRNPGKPASTVDTGSALA